MSPDQRGDLVPEADRRPADQLPGTGDPEQEADHDQLRDRFHGPGAVWMGDHMCSLDELDHERDGQPEQEHRITHGAPPNLTQPDQGQQRRRHEGKPMTATLTDVHPIFCPGSA